MPTDQEYNIEEMASSIDLGLGLDSGADDNNVEDANILNEGGESTVQGGEGQDTVEGADTTTGGTGQDTVQGAVNDVPMPSSWKPETKALWDAATPELRAQIVQREADFHAGIAQYKEDATFGNAFKSLYQPYQELLDANGLTAPQVTQNLLNAQMTLAYGKPEERVALVKSLMSDYGIAPEDLGAAAGSESSEVASLRQTVQTLQSRLDQTTRFVEAQQQATLRSQVTAFLADPKYPHASSLVQEIGTLIKAEPSLTLQQAYEKAVWLNPEIRQKHMTELETQRAADAAKAQKEKAAKAQEAKGKTLPRFGQRTTKPVDTGSSLDSMVDTIKETLRDIEARNK